MATVASLDFAGGGLGDTDIRSGAGIAASKLVHRHKGSVELWEQATTIAALQKLLFITTGSGTLQTFEAAIIVQATGADRTVTVDLHKSTGGGAFATVLTTTVDITDTTTILTPVAAVTSSPAFVDNDIFKIVVSVAGAAGAQAKGLVGTLVYDTQ